MSADLTPPTLNEIRRAHEIISERLSLPTPLVHSPALSERWDAHVSLKLECMTPTSAFKVRGGVYFASQLSDEERAVGLVTSSTGNHGQSIAFGCAAVGAQATIFMPTDANADKIAAIERLAGVSNWSETDSTNHAAEPKSMPPNAALATSSRSRSRV